MNIAGTSIAFEIYVDNLDENGGGVIISSITIWDRCGNFERGAEDICQHIVWVRKEQLCYIKLDCFLWVTGS